MSRMKRRAFIAMLSGAAAWPLAARAQQGERVRRIGVLMGFTTTDPEAQAFQRAFSQRLRELGWTDGTTARFDYRWASGDRERFKAYASELVALKPDVILANTTPAVAALRQETTTLPIVFVQITDPVVQGFVSNLARPGGNMTGFDFVDFAVGGKWLELLKEAAPAVTRVAVMYNPQTSPAGYLPSLRSAATTLRVELTEAPVRDDGEIERVITAMSERPGGGLTVMADVFMAAHRAPIIALAARHRLPVMYPRRIYVMDGGPREGRPALFVLHDNECQPTWVTRCWASSLLAVLDCVGSVRTVAFCPSQSRVSSTILPSGNSSAS